MTNADMTKEALSERANTTNILRQNMTKKVMIRKDMAEMVIRILVYG